MIDSVEFDLQAFEASQAEARKAYEKLGEDSSRKELIEAANDGLISALSRHFAMREKEMPKSTGFPWFGQHYPKRYFWSGSRGMSVSERIRVTLSSPARLVSQVSINSPALAHKLASSPPDIKPKGGRRYLAIPANPIAAAWDDMPRNFPGGLRLHNGPRIGLMTTTAYFAEATRRSDLNLASPERRAWAQCTLSRAGCARMV